MRLLVIDSSGHTLRWLGVEDGQPLDPVEIVTVRGHDTFLAEGVQRWLAGHGWSQPDGIAVVNGPGGYTGLRVGVAFTSAYAVSASIPIVPLNTFDVIAARLQDGLAWVLLPLRRNRCRGKLMRGGVPPLEISGSHEVIVGETVPPGDEPVVPLGECYLKHQGEFDTYLSDRFRKTDELLPHYQAMAMMANHHWQIGVRVDPLQVDIDYGGDFKPTPKNKK